MRARTIKPGFFSNEDLCALPHEARLLFAGLWVLADRAGRLEDRPAKIRAAIFPYEPSMDLEKALEKLDDANLIFRYYINGSSYIQVAKWHVHQHPHPKEQDSIIPPIPFDLTDIKACRDFSLSSRVKVMPCRAFPSIPSIPSLTNPPTPLPSEGGLLLTPPNGTRRRRNSKPTEMPAHQAERYSEWLGLHPKNTVQVVSSRALWKDRVKDDAIADWLIAQLRREIAGDTTYMFGPGKWLADHLALYAAGVNPKDKTVTRQQSAIEEAMKNA